MKLGSCESFLVIRLGECVFGVVELIAFFNGNFFLLPNLYLENMILTYIKDFSWEKMAQSFQIVKKNNSKLPYSNDNIHYVATNIEGPYFIIFIYGM